MAKKKKDGMDAIDYIYKQIEDNKNTTAEEIIRFIDLFDSTMNDYLYVYDMDNDYYYISRTAAEKFNLPLQGYHNVMEVQRGLIYPDDLELFNNEINSITENKRKTHNLTYRWVDKDMKNVWINCRGVVIYAEDGHMRMVAGCINEVGKKQVADNITGLMAEESMREYFLKDGHRKPVYLQRIGIDNFKEINEKYGLDYGDMIISKVVECIKEVLVPGDRIFRIVADEFMIISYDDSEDNKAPVVYERIRKSIKRFIENNGYETFFTVSSGIIYSDKLVNNDYDMIMRWTEFALNEAKKAGKNQYYIFDDKEYEHFIAEKRLTDCMRRSINNKFDGFEVYLQPIVEMEECQFSGAEALLRYNTKETGFVSPAEFIPLLEESGLIVPVGNWVIEKALDYCKLLRKRYPDFRINVNLSYVQILRSDVLEVITNALDERHLPSSAIVVEVTESGLLESNAQFERFCTGLKKREIPMALDDFGTGYSNLRYLYTLNPDNIKIDRSFTLRALNGAYEKTMLRYIVEMAHGIGLKLCIEGIETRDELKSICEINPDYVQGYYYGRPCPLQEFLDRF